MPKPFVSVLIDTYNHRNFIEDAINSVLGQDFPASETEILVVDDGSIDNTSEIVRKFAPRVRLLRKVNGGQASAFNASIPETHGVIVAFLDGDDWWAPRKLTAVTQAFTANADVGLVGHGVTQVYPDGRQRTEVPREASRFRIDAREQAKNFRMRRGFFGTSRMAYRKEILVRVGFIPETIRFEADEYLFTLAGLVTDVMILKESYTFYRLHDGNLFQFTNADEQAIRSKQKVLAALAQALEQRMSQLGVPVEIARTLLECVEVEADVLRLMVDSGFPWETVSTELRIMRVFHSDASAWQQLFSRLRLVPAFVLPAKTYYRGRRWLSLLTFYQELRRRFLPFPMPTHVERREKLAP
jgi:glycosyltransferase involved in cell wall biosynthesis